MKGTPFPIMSVAKLFKTHNTWKSAEQKFITTYHNESDKKVYFGIFVFHWLEIEQIEKILVEISKFELSIEKTIKTRQEIFF